MQSGQHSFASTATTITARTVAVHRQILRDPVVAADGVTYEREAIERHLRHVSTSPVTKQRLASKQVYDNSALRGAIAQWAGGMLPPAPPGTLSEARVTASTGLLGRP
jgi:hypothetical protein